MPIIPYPASYATRYPDGLKPCATCKVSKPFADFCLREDGRLRSDCSECKNAKARLYKDRNAEKVKIANAAYREANRDSLREVSRQWRKDNPTADYRIHRKWKQANPDKVKAQSLIQWARHRDRYVFLINRRTHERRVHIRTNCGTYTRQEWDDQKARQNYCCLMCGKPEPEIKLTIDHVIPVSKGGMNTIDNLQGLCKPCNSRKKDKILDLRTQP